MSRHTRAPVAASGPVFPTIPYVLSDFGDTDIWMPVSSRGADVSIVGNGLRIAGNADDPASSFRYIHAGATGLFKIFPAANGIIEIQSVWDSYIRPTDLAASDDWIFAMALMSEMDCYNGDWFTFYGFGGLSGASQDFAAHGVVPPSTANQAYFAVYTTAAVNTGWTVTYRMNNIVWPPGSVRVQGSEWFEVVGDVSGSLGGAVPTPNAQIVTPTYNQGFRPFIGVNANENSQIAVARCTSFSVLQGRVVSSI
jgi:hypothetical protein